MRVVILCGGKGTRIRGHRDDVPKPLIEIGDRPILWHVMKLYSHFGFRDFVLCLGYKGEKIVEYFTGRHWKASQWQGHGSAIAVSFPGGPEERWDVTMVDTGIETNTGGRIKKVAPYLANGTFMATYADGLANLDLRALLDFHGAHGRAATVTAAQPVTHFGIMELGQDDEIRGFIEKPRLDKWVNGGFFVFEQKLFDYLDEASVLEREPFESMVRDGELRAFRCHEFWACMDTYKDMTTFNQLWQTGQAEWKLWRD